MVVGGCPVVRTRQLGALETFERTCFSRMIRATVFRLALATPSTARPGGFVGCRRPAGSSRRTVAIRARLLTPGLAFAGGVFEPFVVAAGASYPRVTQQASTGKSRPRWSLILWKIMPAPRPASWANKAVAFFRMSRSILRRLFSASSSRTLARRSFSLLRGEHPLPFLAGWSRPAAC